MFVLTVAVINHERKQQSGVVNSLFFLKVFSIRLSVSYVAVRHYRESR